jgi:Trk K+ transport system NAD-binding subunit
VLATIAVSAEVLAVIRLRIEPGCRGQAHPVAELEVATRCRVLLVDDGSGPAWRPPGTTPLAAGAELVVVVPPDELGRVLAWTEAGVDADRHARP